MLNKSEPSLTAVLHAVTKKNPAGLDAHTVADLVEKPYQTLMSELSRQEGHKLGADLVLPLCLVTESDEPIKFLARQLGGVFLRLTEPEMVSADLLKILAASIREFGEFAAQAAASFADGRISKEELERIIKEGYEAVAAAYAVIKQAEIAHERQRGQ